MSDAIASVLSQIRSLQGQIGAAGAPAAGTAAPVRGAGFAETLQNTVGRVNDAQLEANALQSAYEFGDPKVDLVRVMLASQEAQIGFRATVEVRNRLVQAYQEIMNMPL